MNEDFKRGPGRPPKVDAETFPVVLLKNYRPVSSFQIERTEASGKATWQDPTEAEAMKVPAGSRIELDKAEAKRIISLNIAERGDAI